MHGGASDRRKYAFTTVIASDGTSFFESDALTPLLAGGPLSIWTFVGRTVEKLGAPVPELDGILRHLAETIGTSAFGVPRAPAGHQPRHPPIVYLKQLWPQILPIAQPFCRRPAQLPVLFGIALQRAIEHTRSVLDPSLGASIAMESAAAMSRVILPGAAAYLVAPPPAPVDRRSASALASTAAASASPRVASPGRERERALPGRAVGNEFGADAKAFHVGFLAERLAPARNVLTILSLAIIAMTVTILSTDRDEPQQITRETRPLQRLASQAPSLPVAVAATAARAEPLLDTPPIEEMRVAVARNEPLAEEVDAPMPMPLPEQPSNEGIIAEDVASSFESSAGAGADMSGAAIIVES